MRKRPAACFVICLWGMKVPHVGWTGGGIACAQLSAELGSVCTLNSRRVGVKELLQPLVLETFDHAYSAYMRYAAVCYPQ